MEFRFIDNNAPLDRRSQKLVRNHAMKGKNLGRIVPARGHRHQQQQGDIHPHCLTTGSKCSTGDKRRPLLPKAVPSDPNPDITLPLNPFSGTELAYFAVPAPLTSSVRYLFYECGCPSFSRSTSEESFLTKLRLVHYSVSKELYPPVFCRQSEKNETTWFELVIEEPSGKSAEPYSAQGFRFYANGQPKSISLRHGCHKSSHLSLPGL